MGFLFSVAISFPKVFAVLSNYTCFRFQLMVFNNDVVV